MHSKHLPRNVLFKIIFGSCSMSVVGGCQPTEQVSFITEAEKSNWVLLQHIMLYLEGFSHLFHLMNKIKKHLFNL